MEFLHFSLVNKIDSFMKKIHLEMSIWKIYWLEKNTWQRTERSSFENKNECGLEMNNLNSNQTRFLQWYVSSLTRSNLRTYEVVSLWSQRTNEISQLNDLDQVEVCLIKSEREKDLDLKLQSLLKSSKTYWENLVGTVQLLKEGCLILHLKDLKIWLLNQMKRKLLRK